MRGHDEEKFMLMKQEYERYKDLWGLNLHYSHTAGPTKNYSELKNLRSFSFKHMKIDMTKFLSAQKKSLDLQVVHIFFDTSTFDRVEKDVKVTRQRIHFILCPF